MLHAASSEKDQLVLGGSILDPIIWKPQFHPCKSCASPLCFVSFTSYDAGFKAMLSNDNIGIGYVGVGCWNVRCYMFHNAIILAIRNVHSFWLKRLQNLNTTLESFFLSCSVKSRHVVWKVDNLACCQCRDTTAIDQIVSFILHSH